MKSGVCWIDGKIMAASEARISVMDHGLLYGDGVFEGIRFYQGKAFMLEAHLRRLRDSAQAICLNINWSDQELTGIINKLIKAYADENGYIRLIVTRGEGSLGIDPRHCPTPSLVIIASGLSMVSEEIRQHGARAIIASTRRLSSDSLDPRIKSLNYLNHILARIEANHAGADEAILLNQSGKVCEGSADNLFIVRDRDLITPPITDGALDGITRRQILTLANDLGIQAVERSLAPFDLYTADECFLTGTGAELIPVREVDGRNLKACPGATFGRLQQAFDALTQQ